jgi:hypothetical protein
MTPDWLDWILPFLSGFCGVGIGYGTVKQSIADHSRRLDRMEEKLEGQVGDSRCRIMREECRDNISDMLKEIKQEIISNRNWVTDRFTEIARFMGAHNGK